MTGVINGDGRVGALARAELAQMSIDIAATPLDVGDETVKLASARAAEMVDRGLVDRADAADAIWSGAEASGLVQQRGADAVQKLVADGFGSSAYKDTTQSVGADAPSESASKSGGARRSQAQILGDPTRTRPVPDPRAHG